MEKSKEKKDKNQEKLVAVENSAEEVMETAATADEEMTAQETKLGGGVNKKKFIVGFLVGLLIILAVTLVVTTVAFYKNPGTNKYVDGIALTLHLPVAKADGQFISYNRYNEAYTALKRYFTVQNERGAVATVPSDMEIRKNVLDRLIDEVFLNKLTQNYGISVSNIEVEAEWQTSIVGQVGTEDEVIKEVGDLYDWTPAKFKEEVVKKNLIYDRLATAVAVDPDIQSEVKEKAEEVLAKVKSGEQSFEDLAKEYSEDTGTKDSGGELGWFSMDTMVKEFADAAFSLQPGEISDLVKTSYGYHIIKVEEKKAAVGEDPEQVRAQHILIQSKDLATYLEDLRGKTTIKKYIPVEN
ncbi:MAG: peptidylprolyl isomerase [Patescibacteria group bacterium]